MGGCRYLVLLRYDLVSCVLAKSLKVGEQCYVVVVLRI